MEPLKLGKVDTLSTALESKAPAEGQVSFCSKWLALFEEAPPFSTFSDLLNCLSTKKLDKYCFKFRKNREGSIEDLEVTLENAVVAVSSFSDLPTRLIFSKEGKLTVLTLFREPCQIDYIDTESGKIQDIVIQNAFLKLENEQLYCPGFTKDIASRALGEEIVCFKYPFERYQSVGCPVWFDPPEDEIITSDILIRKEIHPCSNCFKLCSLVSSNLDVDAHPAVFDKAASNENLSTMNESVEHPCETNCTKKKRVVMTPTIVHLRPANSNPHKKVTIERQPEKESNQNSSGNENFSFAEAPEFSDTDGSSKLEETSLGSCNEENTSGDESRIDSSAVESAVVPSESLLEIKEPECSKKQNLRVVSKKERIRKRLLKEIFRCEDCDKNFTSEKPWKVHRAMEHNDQKPYKCDLECAFSFCEKSELVEHYSTLHTDDEVHKCRFCYRQYFQLAELRTHARYHRNDKPVKCPHCPKILSNRIYLKEHEKTHIKDGIQKRFICEYCGQGFTKTSSLNSHNRIHTGEKPYQCQKCGKSFTYKHVLEKHYRVHTGEKSFLCAVCGKSFRFKWSLEKHTNSHVDNKHVEKADECGNCGKGYHCRCELANHAVTHTGEKTVDGKTCQIKFGKLAQHARTHTGESSFRCETCDKTFTVKNSLITHMRTHTGERPFQCQFCGKCFSQKPALVAHTRIHTGERNHKCEVCGRAFITRDKVKQHMVTHTGERPYRCDICNKCFGQKSTLNGHTRTHVGKKTRSKPATTEGNIQIITQETDEQYNYFVYPE